MRPILIALLVLIVPWFAAQETRKTRPREAPRADRRDLDRRIAARFAPVIKQGLGDQPRSDYITNFDFDGDWNGDNNWTNAGNPSFPLRAWLYYSVIETETHYFLCYAVFHPRDYKAGVAQSELLQSLINLGVLYKGDPTGGLADDVALSHENDLEGCLIVAEKRGGDPAQAVVQFIETVAHNRFPKYRPASAVSGASSVGEVIEMQGQRPVLFAEPKGHGISRYTGTKEQLKKSVNGVLSYEYAGRAVDPEKTGEKTIGYDLAPIFDAFWQRAQAGENETFGEAADYPAFKFRARQPDGKEAALELKLGKFGSAFRGTVGFKNKARPPWGWFDQSDRANKADKTRPPGEWFFDPAAVIARDFNPGESFSRVYLWNPYLIREQ